MRKKIAPPPKPDEFLEDVSEDERKYKVRGCDFATRVAKLNEIFAFVAGDKNHFVTLESELHTNGYDAELVALSQSPNETKALRRRLYWGVSSLIGYKPRDKDKIELRTEQKIGKLYWEQVLKLGGNGSKTLKRKEHKRHLDGFGVNLLVYPKDVFEKAHEIVGDAEFKPLVKLEGQSRPLLYHPDGRADIVLEIKFDMGKSTTFDGYKEDLVEVEIEIKEHPDTMSEDDLEDLLNKTESVLFANFADDLENVYESKVSPSFRHLVGLRSRDKAGFDKMFKDLPVNWWSP